MASVYRAVATMVAVIFLILAMVTNKPGICTAAVVYALLAIAWRPGEADRGE